MFGKDNKKKELVNNLAEIYGQIEREHQISPGDFPNLKRMQVTRVWGPRKGASRLSSLSLEEATLGFPAWKLNPESVGRPADGPGSALPAGLALAQQGPYLGPGRNMEPQRSQWAAVLEDVRGSDTSSS